MKKKFFVILFILLIALTLVACGNVEFKVNFVVDGEVVHTINTNGNESIVMPNNPTKDGYSFIGWYWDKDVWQQPFTANSLLDAPLSSDMQVYARWRSSAKTTYQLKGMFVYTSIGEMFIDPDDMSSSEKAVYDQTINMYGKSVKVGDGVIEFDGLVLSQFNPADFSSNGKNVVFSDTTLRSTFNYVNLENGVFSLGFSLAGTTIVFEYYAPNYVTQSYNLIFNYNNATGGDYINEVSIQFNTSVGDLPEPTRTGYTFNGWTNTYLGAFDKDTKFVWKYDVTVMAQWTANSYRMSFSYDGATGGNSTAYKTVVFNEAVGALPTPTKPNYNFEGWFTNGNGEGTRITPEYVWTFSENTYIYSKWSGLDKTIYFNYEGATTNNVVESMNVIYGKFVGTLPNPIKTDNTFGGWFTQPGGAGDKFDENTIYYNSNSTILYAKWETELTFDYQGATGGTDYLTTIVFYNASIPGLPSPTRTGYQFGGWFTQPGGGGTQYTPTQVYKQATGITLYAKWNTTITFDYQNATGGFGSTSMSVAWAKAIGSLPTPRRAGYEFVGWFTQIEGSGTQYTSTTEYGASGPITLFAAWDANPYTITFNYQGATGDNILNAKAVIFDTEIGFLPIPTKTGNTFEGWFTEVGGKGAQYTASTIYKQTVGMTLYAKWNTVITFDYQSATGDNGVVDKTVTYYALADTFPTPTRTGYTFGGWFTEVGGKGTEYTASTIYTQTTGTTLYAKWYATLHYDYQGATGEATIRTKTVVFNTEIGSLPIPTKTGNTFGGWFTEVGGAGIEYTASTVYTHITGITIYAKWSTIITFDYQGATGENTIDSKTIVVYTEVGSLPIPTKTGNTFDGWFDQPGGFGMKYTDSTVYWPIAGITLYAKWNTTITYDYQSATGENSVSTKSVTYNATVGAFSSPTKTSYIFAGWFTEVGGAGTEYIASTLYTQSAGITLYAKWTTTITYDYQEATGGNALLTRTVTYNAAFGVLPSPEKTAYIFDGWFTSVDGGGIEYTPETIISNPIGTITLYAKWVYNGIWIADEASLILIANNLSGYYKLANNITLTADWIPLGNENIPFSGIFDGNGFTVSDLNYDSSAHNSVGLFGASSGILRNAGIIDYSINVAHPDNVYAGGLVGYNTGKIINCYTSGDVIANNTNSSVSAYAPPSYAGGLAGCNILGEIVSCYAIGAVTSGVRYNSSFAGGLVGYNTGNITSCYADVVVKATRSSSTSYYSSYAYAGGLVGYSSVGKVVTSYAIGNVNASGSGGSNETLYAGGLMGVLGGTGILTNCYATGNVNVNSSGHSAIVGGLLGDNNGTVTNCYAAGNVSATSNGSSNNYAAVTIGGLIGYNEKTTINCYAIGNVSAIATSTASINMGGVFGRQYIYGDYANCYSYDGQVFYSKQNTVEDSSPTNNLGVAVSKALYDTQSFYVNTLLWSDGVWNFNSLDFEIQLFPTLLVA